MGPSEIVTAEIRCIVSGKVQGVFYRGFISRHARRLSLVGFVKNLDSGHVEIVAQGPRAELEKLLEHARRGPLLARVSNIEVEWRKPTESLKSFEVVF